MSFFHWQFHTVIPPRETTPREGSYESWASLQALKELGQSKWGEGISSFCVLAAPPVASLGRTVCCHCHCCPMEATSLELLPSIPSTLARPTLQLLAGEGLSCCRCTAGLLWDRGGCLGGLKDNFPCNVHLKWYPSLLPYSIHEKWVTISSPHKETNTRRWTSLEAVSEAAYHIH